MAAFFIVSVSFTLFFLSTRCLPTSLSLALSLVRSLATSLSFLYFSVSHSHPMYSPSVYWQWILLLPTLFNAIDWYDTTYANRYSSQSNWPNFARKKNQQIFWFYLFFFFVINLAVNEKKKHNFGQNKTNWRMKRFIGGTLVYYPNIYMISRRTTTTTRFLWNKHFFSVFFFLELLSPYSNMI